MIINCDIKLILDESETPTTPEEIFKKVFTLEKYDVHYKEGPIYHMEFKGDKLINKFIEVGNENDAFNDVNGGGIYFIFNEDESKVLYVGKSQDIKKRLKEHLCKCSASTSSHIDDVIEYLKSKKDAKELHLKYCVLNTKDNKHNATIEGALIDYMIESCDSRFKECWNKRID